LLNADAPRVDMGLKWDPEAGCAGIEGADPLIEREDRRILTPLGGGHSKGNRYR